MVIGIGTIILPPPPPQNIKIGLFSLAGTISALVTTTNIYTYSSNTVTFGTNLLASSNHGCGGAGNAQLAVINLMNSANTNIYTYSTNNVVMGTAFQGMPQYGTASGNAVLGIYLGINSYNGSGCYQQYMYANNTTSTTINNTPYHFGGGSTSTSTFGLFNLGSARTSNNYAMTNIYQYSTNTISNGTNIFNGITYQAYGNAAGNAIMGVFNAGAGNDQVLQFALNIYMYSSNAVTTGVTLSALSESGMATGNDIEGIFTLGNNVTTTNVYTYNNNTVVVGTNLTAAGFNGTGTSSYNPGVNT